MAGRYSQEKTIVLPVRPLTINGVGSGVLGLPWSVIAVRSGLTGTQPRVGFMSLLWYLHYDLLL